MIRRCLTAAHPKPSHSKPSMVNTLKTVITNVMINAMRKTLTEASIDGRVMRGLVAAESSPAKGEIEGLLGQVRWDRLANGQ